MLNLLIFWYEKQQLYIGWVVKVSTHFNMSNGIRQGSLISPLLFSVYLGDLSGNLNIDRIGYHFGGRAMNHLAYAHDLVLTI